MDYDTKNHYVNDRKLFVFDGIGGAPLGRELFEAFVQQGLNAFYLDAQDLPKKPFFDIRGKIAKSINKIKSQDSFYHFPKTTEKSFGKILERERPDIVLVVGFLYRFISPAFATIMKKRLRFLLFLYDTDSCNFYSRRREFVFFLQEELPIYDRIFSFSRVTADFFKNVRDLDSAYFPFGAKPISVDRPQKRNVDVLFVGTADLRRVFLLEKVREYVTIYGKRWDRHYAFMSRDLRKQVNYSTLWGGELHKTLAASKIILNITRSNFFAAETGINLRIFEALATGCFLLTDYCDELKSVFELGLEIETFKSSEELREKVEYFLKHDRERQEIARKGHERFLHCHTWEARARDIWAKMNDC